MSSLDRATMSQPTPPAMRIKSRWFSGRGETPVPKSAAEQASAVAFIVWRVAVQMLARMRAARFELDAGAPYFAFVREALVFLATVADRIAYQRLEADERAEFVVALVRHLARHLEENADRLLGPPPAGQPGHGDRFIDLFNELAGHYAEFGADPHASDREAGFEPDFAFLRYLGSRLEPVLPEHDRRYVLDQVMAIEAPAALDIVRRAMLDLFDPKPRRARRATLSGD